VLWAGNKVRPRDIYLGTRTVAWVDGNGATVAASIEGMESAVFTVRDRLEESVYKGRLRIWLSGGLCRPFLLPDLSGVVNPDEILRVASRLAIERTGLSGNCKVWLDRPRRGTARMAVAVAQGTLDALHAELGGRWRIDAIRPWWTEVLRVALSREETPCALGVQDCDSLTLLMGKKNSFDAASTICPVLDEAAANSAFARALLSADIPQGEEMLARLTLGTSRLPGPQDSALASLMEFSR
jgi:hypothetical protein